VRALLAAVLLAGLAAGAARADSTAAFQTPSRNIGCTYVPAFAGSPRPSLRCDIGGGLHPLPPRPKSCDLDWGYGYETAGTGLARPFCAGDTARDPRAGVLAYDRSWRRRPFRCTSQRAGLRCTNGSRHGFFLSRERSYTF
jgi:hypothetical protein